MQKKKKTKRKSLSSIKARAWKAFSEFIRLRDSDENGNCICITCGNSHHWKQMQAGHLISGRSNSVLFNEEIVNAQCMQCNVFKGGQYIEYWLEMEKRIGRERCEQLLALKNQTVKYSYQDYVDIFKKYTDAVSTLKKEKING